MANIQNKPKFYHVAAGSLLARYIRFVARTSWQTREQLEAVKAEGCTEMQGFLLSRALPANAIAKFLQAAKATRQADAQDAA